MKAEERRFKAAEAYLLFIQRVSKTEISRRLKCGRQTVYTLIDEEIKFHAQDRNIDKELEKAISTYEAVIQAAWEKFKVVDPRSLNSSGYLNTIITAQKHIVELILHQSQANPDEGLKALANALEVSAAKLPANSQN
jgi:hypothetical protein